MRNPSVPQSGVVFSALWAVLNETATPSNHGFHFAPCVLTDPWMLSAGTSAILIHRIKTSVIVWRNSDFFRLGVRTECGKDRVVAETYREAPDADLCDDCLLGADFAVPIVYRAFAANDDLVYLGSSTRLDRRIRAHRVQSRWYGLVSRWDWEVFPSELAARNAERVAIERENPRRNRSRPPVQVLEAS